MRPVPQRLRAMMFALAVIALMAVPRPGQSQERRRPGAGPRPTSALTASARKPGALKKYAEVITPEAHTYQGVFTVHRVDDKIYYEIPAEAYGKLMLWSTEVAKAPSGVSYGGSALGTHVVHWERRDNKVYLWSDSFSKHGDGKAVQRAVDSANMGSIIMSFQVEAEGRDRAAVIDVTPLFTSEVPEFSLRRLGSAVDSSRTYVQEVKAFPTNIEIRSLLTFRSAGGSGGFGAALPRRSVFSGGNSNSISALLHYSMTLLPEKPMQGRYFDPRVGYFVQPFEDYTSDRNWVMNHEFIARYRLEKKDPQAEVSEPAKPIVFYISREVPEKWRSYLKQGVEDWKPVFEKAGFKDAIQCKDAPSAEDDPSWDPEDARYSVIRWVALPIENAMGPNVHDPRSGEIVSAHVIVWHDVLKLVQEWYFAQCGALDPQAKKLPLPDELTGKLLRMVITHEVGHTLGLRHNQRATSAYSIAQLRDPKFTAEHGTTASIMSYGRFNYVAQPEDKVTSLIPKIGPYDYFAIEWGYKPIAGASTPEAERPTLDKWAARQMEEPWLRFGGEDGPALVDPTVKTENIGSDSLEATALGLKNLDRVIDMLLPATTRLGEDDTVLKDTYQSIMSHRANWFRAVELLVGGVTETRSLGHGSTETFRRVPKDKQKEAVRFLLDKAFTTPHKLLQPPLVSRFKYFGVANDVMSQQKSLLESLLSGRRFHQMMDAEVVSPRDTYTAMEFLGDVQNGLWKELDETTPKIDVCRRQLQRAYLDYLNKELNSKDEGSVPSFPRRGDMSAIFSADSRDTDFRAVARANLEELQSRLKAAIAKNSEHSAVASRVKPGFVPLPVDAMTKVHLQECQREIERILNPKN
jgi:Met-zincin/Domain of unknown function (DUF5117)/Domain of unknown function (DUF5118)